MVAAHLLRAARRPLEISLIERRSVMGQGLAYSTTLGTHVLNVPAARMGAFAESVDDFQRWLKALEPEFGAFAADGFVPRIWYGTYLRAILAEAEIAAHRWRPAQPTRGFGRIRGPDAGRRRRRFGFG